MIAPDSDESPLWLLCSHFALLSMMAVGGGVVMLAPDIHRYVVDAHQWITSEQFAAAYTIAQAAPGPNMLYVTLIGWQVAGFTGAMLATVAIVIPPVILTIFVTRVSARAKVGRFGRAVRKGLAPLSVGLLAAGGAVLVEASDRTWQGYLLTALTVAVMLRTRVNPVWLIAAGGILGVLAFS